MIRESTLRSASARRSSESRHLGIQVEDRAELAEVFERIEHTQRPVLNEGKTTCCYAKSEKNWVEDPQGVQWETFLTTGESTVYGGEAVEGARARPCCAPT